MMITTPSEWRRRQIEKKMKNERMQEEEIRKEKILEEKKRREYDAKSLGIIRITKCDHELRIILLGSSGVGKSTLLYTYNNDIYEPQIATIGIDLCIKQIKHDNKQVKLIVYDTAGQEKFEAITRSFYQRAMGAVIICDLTDGWSTIRALNYYNELCKQVGENIPVLLVANKCDILISKKITTKIIDTKELLSYIDDQKEILSEIRRLAESMNTEFIITSAKTNINVSTVFELITSKILQTLYSIVGGVNIKNKDTKETTCPCSII